MGDQPNAEVDITLNIEEPLISIKLLVESADETGTFAVEFIGCGK